MSGNRRQEHLDCLAQALGLSVEELERRGQADDQRRQAGLPRVAEPPHPRPLTEEPVVCQPEESLPSAEPVVVAPIHRESQKAHILRVLGEKSLTVSEISLATGLGPEVTRTTLANLRSNGKVESIGPFKARRYRRIYVVSSARLDAA